MSKKVDQPPKISGDPQKFPTTPKNFRRPPKISGDPRKFPATTKTTKMSRGEKMLLFVSGVCRNAPHRTC